MCFLPTYLLSGVLQVQQRLRTSLQEQAQLVLLLSRFLLPLRARSLVQHFVEDPAMISTVSTEGWSTISMEVLLPLPFPVPIRQPQSFTFAVNENNNAYR